DLDNTDDSKEFMLSFSAWGYDEDVLHLILDAVDDVLYDTTLTTTNWAIVYCRREDASSTASGGFIAAATQQTIHQLEATYRLVAHKR
ncbi:MAG: hypothetical protein ABII76_24725, partial [Pseudomonadota bacterium]